MSIEQKLLDNLSSDPEMEKNIVAYCMMNAIGVGYFPTILPNHFSTPRFQGYWEAIMHLANTGQDVTPMQVRAYCKGHSYDFEALDVTEDSLKVFLAKGRHNEAEERLIELWKKREIRRIGREMAENDLSIEEVQQLVNEMLIGGQATEAQSLSDLAPEVIDKLERNYNAKQTGQELPDAVYLGIPEIDKQGAMMPGDLLILAGRPGMGKSTVSRWSAMHIARKFPVLMLTQEMTKDEILTLMGATKGRVDSQRIRQMNINQTEYSALIKGLGDAATLDIHIDYIRELSAMLAGIRAWRMATDQSKPAVVILDYLQQVRVKGKFGTRNEEVGFVSRSLKEIATHLNLVFISLAQLNRSVEHRGGDKIPQLSDLRDSGEIEQDASSVIFLYRPEYYGFDQNDAGESNEGLVQAIISKNRHGKVGTVSFYFDLSKGQHYSQNQSINLPSPGNGDDFAPF